MRNNRKSRPSPRGLLADQGSGKGDKPRHTLNKQWQDNYDSIDWGRPHAEDYIQKYLISLMRETITVKRHTI